MYEVETNHQSEIIVLGWQLVTILTLTDIVFSVTPAFLEKKKQKKHKNIYTVYIIHKQILSTSFRPFLNACPFRKNTKLTNTKKF